MQNAYIIVQSGHPVTLQSEVNRFAKEGYEPVGGIMRHCWGDESMTWCQAMYRAPEPDNRSDTDAARAARLALRIMSGSPGVGPATAVAVALETINPSEGAVGIDISTDPDIDRRDLSNYDGERPLDRAERLLCAEKRSHEDTKACLDAWRNSGQEAANERDEARAECERLRESGGMDKLKPGPLIFTPGRSGSPDNRGPRSRRFTVVVGSDEVDVGEQASTLALQGWLYANAEGAGAPVTVWEYPDDERIRWKHGAQLKLLAYVMFRPKDADPDQHDIGRKGA